MILFPNPASEDIFLTRFFHEPLVPIGIEPTPEESSALVKSLTKYSRRKRTDDFSEILKYIETHPNSPWKAALLANLGFESYSTGHYSQVISFLEQAWELSKNAAEWKGKALADLIVGELAYMHARLGQMKELQLLLASVEGRAFCGPATEKITGAREGLWNMQHRPNISFRCGPFALYQIKRHLHPQNSGTDIIFNSVSTQKGFSLRELVHLSQQLGLNFQMAFRQKNNEFVIPSVVHLKLGHYAAIVRQKKDRFLLQDPTFGKDVWVNKTTLEEESSGYFLIPDGPLPEGWRLVSEEEGDSIWGKGITENNNPGPHGPDDPKPRKDCHEKGMAYANVHLMLVSLNIIDEPLGYAPPVGPKIGFTVRYNQREAFQPANFNYSNLGSKWTFDWLSYITEDLSSQVTDSNYYLDYYIMGGGTRTFRNFNLNTNALAPEQFDQTRLTRTSANSYEMVSRDGTRKIFAQPDGATRGRRRIFLSKLIDAHGNAVSLNYDAQLRITSIEDAIGQLTTISYEYPADPFKITKVTDPFGRFATFEYDDSKRLTKITDVMGIVSRFDYDTGDFITVMTTPYGVTRFTKGEPNSTTRSLEILHPDGNRERVEYNHSVIPNPNGPGGYIKIRLPGMPAPEDKYFNKDPHGSVPSDMLIKNDFLIHRNTYYWDKKAYALGADDYSKAKRYHWLHMSNSFNLTEGILESEKAPLEGRVWYEYEGQPDPLMAGTTNKPKRIGRVLDDGYTQLYTYEYNDFGNVTKYVDPIGRTFSFLYASNGIDLLETRQTRAGQDELLAQNTYNDQHLILTNRDAAGQLTVYSYNSRGQLLTQTNAQGHTITFHYNTQGYLTAIDGPMPDAKNMLLYTYDAFGRVRTKTDLDGYTLTFEYDVLDRLTKTTYPDGTFDEYTFERLHLKHLKDRAGRITAFEYNSVQQMVKRTDALDRTTYFQWCKCGDLRSLTDPMGRTTFWHHDLQGRLIAKEYADGSKVTYRYELFTSRLYERIDEKLQVTRYNYHRDNTLSRIGYTNTAVYTPDVSFAYDENYARLTSMTDGIGTTLYDYFPVTAAQLGAGQLSSIKSPVANEHITFEYDELGRRVSTAIDGVVSQISYDGLGRIVGANNALGAFVYEYAPGSFRQIAQISPNGLISARAYSENSEDRLLQRITHRFNNDNVSEFSYERDVPTGQITVWSQQLGEDPASIYRFGYDLGSQLTSVGLFKGNDRLQSLSYEYDQASNRSVEQVDNTMHRFSYNILNQVTSAEGLDANTTTYEWDAEQRLISLNNNGRVTLFTYDGLGRCVKITQTSNNVVSYRLFTWCGSEICEERTSNFSVLKRFFEQGVKIETGAIRGVYFYTRDHLGSVRQLVDADGKIRASYNYDPYGRRTRVAGDLEADFGFAGMFWLKGAELYLTWFRAYDPVIGRWLSRDQLMRAEIGEGPNLYAYVGNNPVNFIDPLGLQNVVPKSEQSPAPASTNTTLCGMVVNSFSCWLCLVSNAVQVYRIYKEGIGQFQFNLAPSGMPTESSACSACKNPLTMLIPISSCYPNLITDLEFPEDNQLDCENNWRIPCAPLPNMCQEPPE